MIRTCPSCGAPNRVPASRIHQRPRCGRCRALIVPLDAPYPIASGEVMRELLTESSLPVLVDFWAAWCGPCRMVAPEIEQLAREQSGKLIVAKLDTEALPAIARQHDVNGIPTLILFVKGQEIRRITGAMRAGEIARTLGLSA